MATFEQHINGAVIATGVAIVPLHNAGLLSVNESVIVLALGIIGGVLPDLDSDSSKPIQIVFKILAIFLPLLALLGLSLELPLSYLVGVWIFSGLVLHLTLFKFLLSLTHHRGVFHSIPMGIVIAQIFFSIFHHIIGYSIEFSTIAGLFMFYGFMIHLILDEIVSLNIFGIKIKHSFGSALKLYDKNNLYGTLGLYLFIGLFFLYIPIAHDIFLKIFEVMQNVEVF
jgi:hypothetical protein